MRFTNTLEQQVRMQNARGGIIDMSDLVRTATLISAIVCVVLLGIKAGGWISRWREKKSATDKIIKFLADSEAQGEHGWRSTHAIQKGTNVPSREIVGLCSRDKRIERSGKEKEVWRLKK
jgi:hypothetical protein